MSITWNFPTSTKTSNIQLNLCFLSATCSFQYLTLISVSCLYYARGYISPAPSGLLPQLSLPQQIQNPRFSVEMKIKIELVKNKKGQFLAHFHIVTTKYVCVDHLKSIESLVPQIHIVYFHSLLIL